MQSKSNHGLNLKNEQPKVKDEKQIIDHKYEFTIYDLRITNNQ